MTFTTVSKQVFAVSVIAAVALLSAGSAMAQEFTPDQPLAAVITSTATRAEVLAEAAAFRASGTVSPWSRNYVQRIANPQLRATVKADTLRAIENGDLVSAGQTYGIAPAAPQKLASRAR